MIPSHHAGEVGVSGDRTVVVGVKLSPESKELLTWAMVKAVQPGDRVIALHILSNSNNGIADPDGMPSILSLVKAFDSVLSVYEGFCNLKQVDLKLKICRGSSIRKIIVREAKSYSATEVIVGTSQVHHKIRSPHSVAKYCAKKLPRGCSVLAVDNGKVVFQRETSNGHSKGNDFQPGHCLFGSFHKSFTRKSLKLLPNLDDKLYKRNAGGNLDLAVVKAGSDQNSLKGNCSICSPDSAFPRSSNAKSTDEAYDDSNEGSSMALVPFQNIESLSTSSPELIPGWPLLRRSVFSEWLASSWHLRQISVVQWAMQLPSRRSLEYNSNQEERQSSTLNAESGAIVVFDADSSSIPSSPSSSRNLPEELEGLQEKYSATCRFFTYQELLQATSNFIPENLIGQGGNSQVYRGCLPDGKEIAVKILKPSEDVLKEFVLEIEIITSLHHKNIISLFGFCFEGGNLLMVYDFLSRGSVEENLHGSKVRNQFGWQDRFKVAVGVAEALEYLHCTIDKPVIHRDVKSSNILLYDDFEPQLSDFGLAKWALESSSYITCTDVAGTFGYLAPEYFMYGKVNDKVDVYAFGVVLLELLSGRKPINNDCPKGQESLVMWAKPILNGGKFTELLDPKLVSDYDPTQMELMVLAATLCISRAPRARPTMSTVLKLLQGDPEEIKWARLQVNVCEGTEATDDDSLPNLNIKSHLSLALLDVEDDSLSTSSIERNASIEDYLRGRWSRSPSFD